MRRFFMASLSFRIPELVLVHQLVIMTLQLFIAPARVCMPVEYAACPVLISEFKLSKSEESEKLAGLFWIAFSSQVECSPFCTRVLSARMSEGNLPQGNVFPDIVEYCPKGDVLLAAEALLAGFPCQVGLAVQHPNLLYCSQCQSDSFFFTVRAGCELCGIPRRPSGPQVRIDPGNIPSLGPHAAQQVRSSTCPSR